MSIVAPITVAWQNVTNSSKGRPKQVETYNDLEDAVVRARNVVNAAEDQSNSNFSGTGSQVHITIHPGTYNYGSSVTKNDDLEDVFITVLPGAVIQDKTESISSSAKANIADLKSLSRNVTFSETQNEFIYDFPVRFREEVIFEETELPVKSIQAGDSITTNKSLGDVTISHANTGGASGNNNTTSFLNEVVFDNKGHVESAGFQEVDTGKGVEVENNSSDVVSLASTLNFGQNISATKDQTERVTVSLKGTDGFEISDVEKILPRGNVVSKISGTQGSKAVLSSSVEGFAKNELFENSTDEEKGVVDSSVNGQVNPQVEETPSYVANSFSPGSVGTLKLVVNDSVLVTANLNLNDSSFTKTSVNGSEISVSSAAPLNFQNGDLFEERTQRTATWEVKESDMSLGLNKIKVRHEDDSQNLIGESQTVKYYLEDTSQSITFENESLENLNLGLTKQLSGVTYHKQATFDYSVDVNNVYQTVYGSGDAISYPQLSGVDSEPVPSLSGSPNTQLNIQKTVTVGSDVVIADNIDANIQIEDPIEGIKTSSGVSDFQILVDKLSKENDDLTHYFEKEEDRLAPDSNFDTNLSGNYDSSETLKDGNLYGDQLQISKGKILYPSLNYSAISDGPTGNPDYGSNVTGRRDYYGVFTNNQAVSNFVLQVKGNGEIVSEPNLSTSSDKVAIAIKVPDVTGWMDIGKPFSLGNHEDGDGAYREKNAQNPNRTIGPNSEIGLTIGTKVTSSGFDKLYYRIRSSEFWTGEIEEMNISWGTI